MTRFNKKLAARPDHSHYPACLDRKVDIEKTAVEVLVYTVSVCVIMLIFSIFMQRFAVISWIPSLFGESTDAGPFFLQLLLIIAFAFVSALNCSEKYKVCGLVIFGMYSMMAVFGFIGINSNSCDLLTFAFGAFGTARTFRLVPDYLDWKQLRSTEGYPHFNIRFTVQNEHPEYQPQHTGAGSSENMSDPEVIAVQDFTGQDIHSQMPELGSDRAAIPAVPFTPDYLNEPDKYCTMSESPIKTS